MLYRTFLISDISYLEKIIIAAQELNFQTNKWTALIGKSGQGKTTLLKTLLKLRPGLINQTAGQRDSKEYGQSTVNLISYMPQQDLLLPWKTVLENVTLGNKLRGHELRKQPLKNQQYAHYVLDAVGLWPEKYYYPHQLSLGMRQRVSLARTLMEDTDIVLLDEPFSAVDLQLRQQLYNLTKNLTKGKTVIFVSHDLQEVCTLADQVLVLRGQPAVCHRVTNFKKSPLGNIDDKHPPIIESVTTLLQALYS